MTNYITSLKSRTLVATQIHSTTSSFLQKLTITLSDHMNQLEETRKRPAETT